MRRVFNTIPVVSDVKFKTFFILPLSMQFSQDFISLIDSPFNSVLPTYFSIKSQLDIFGLIPLNLISTFHKTTPTNPRYLLGPGKAGLSITKP